MTINHCYLASPGESATNIDSYQVYTKCTDIEKTFCSPHTLQWWNSLQSMTISLAMHTDLWTIYIVCHIIGNLPYIVAFVDLQEGVISSKYL